jgi:hypothetical protein
MKDSEKQLQRPTTRPKHCFYEGGQKTRTNKLQQKVSEMKSENLTFKILAGFLSFIQIHKKLQYVTLAIKTRRFACSLIKILFRQTKRIR